MKYISKNVTKWLLYDCSRHNGPITLSLIASILYYCPRAQETYVLHQCASNVIFCRRRCTARFFKPKNAPLVRADLTYICTYTCEDDDGIKIAH